MTGRHATRTDIVPPALRRLGAVALTSTAVMGAAGASLAGLTGTALAAPTASAPAVKGMSSAAMGKQVVAEARKHLGTPYKYGADGPSSFDCSGLTQYVFDKIGVELPRTAAQQQDAVKSIPKGSMQPGDLIFQGRNAYHVAIYAGNGKMITAPEEGQDVKLADLPGKYTAGRAQ